MKNIYKCVYDDSFPCHPRKELAYHEGQGGGYCIGSERRALAKLAPFCNTCPYKLIIVKKGLDGK